MQAKAIKYLRLKEFAESLGLTFFATTSSQPLWQARERLERWQQLNHTTGMRYMLRSAELLASPQKLLPDAKTVLVFGLKYAAGLRAACPPGYGWIARYAGGPDYHEVLGGKLKKLIALITQEIGPFNARAFADAVPLLERALAERAGLGFIGKNTMLIKAGTGSFFFLAEILADLSIEDALADGKVYGRCGSCTRCLNTCPTGAFAAPCVLRADRCISYLTIEKRGALSPAEREAIGAWLFGCDICQEVCPFNHAGLRGGVPAAAELMVNLEDVLAIRDGAGFRKRFSGSCLLRARRAGLLRNAAVVAANTLALNLRASLELALKEDSSALVRQHAFWALWKMAHAAGERQKRAIGPLLDRALADPAAEVRAEARTLTDTN